MLTRRVGELDEDRLGFGVALIAADEFVDSTPFTVERSRVSCIQNRVQVFL